MVRVNLLESAGPGIYGTATPKELLEVCFCAFLYCLGMVIMAYGAVRLLEILMR